MRMTSITATAETRCLRPGCGRKLTRPESIARGYGDGCWRKVRAAQATADLSAWTPSQIEDAVQAIEDGAVVPSTRQGVFHVVSSDGDEVHLTHRGGCNCENGLKTRQPRPCYHRCAITIVLASQAPAEPVHVPAQAARPMPSSAELWAEMDRLTDAFMAIG